MHCVGWASRPSLCEYYNLYGWVAELTSSAISSSGIYNRKNVRPLLARKNFLIEETKKKPVIFFLLNLSTQNSTIVALIWIFNRKPIFAESVSAATIFLTSSEGPPSPSSSTSSWGWSGWAPRLLRPGAATSRSTKTLGQVLEGFLCINVRLEFLNLCEILLNDYQSLLWFLSNVDINF